MAQVHRLWLWGLLLLLGLPLQVWAQQQEEGNEQQPPLQQRIRNHMDQKEWAQAQQLISERLKDIYSERMDNEQVPSDQIDTAILRAEKKQKRNIQRKPHRFKAENQFIEKHQELFTLHTNLGFCFFHQNKHHKAIRNFREALRYKKIKPDQEGEYAFIPYQIAQSYEALEQPGGYLRAMENAVAMDQGNAQYLRELGMKYRFRQKKRAAHYLERYLQKRSDRQKARDNQAQKENNIYLILSGLKEQNHRYIQTLKYYRKYLENHPNDGKVAYAAGVIAQERLGDFADSLRLYRQSLEHIQQKDSQRRFAIHKRVGDIFAREGQHDKAVSHIKASIPHFKRITGQVASIDQRIQQIKSRMEGLKRKILQQNDKRSQEILADMQRQLKQQKKRREQNQTRRRGYSMGRLHWDLAQNYESQGKLRLSLEHYQKAMEAGYKIDTTYQKIQRLKVKLQRQSTS